MSIGRDQCVRAAALEQLKSARLTGGRTQIRDAENEVVVAHLRLAAGLARRFRGRGVSDADLQQTAYLALSQCARRWDPDLASGFEVYAIPFIVGSLKHVLRDHRDLVRVPRPLQTLAAEAATVGQILAQELGREPRTDEIAQALGCSTTELDSARHARVRIVSDDCLVDRGYPGAPDQPAAVDLWLDLKAAADSLAYSERRLLWLYYFEDWTQARIGRSFGVSQMQISRLHKAILSKLRDQMAA